MAFVHKGWSERMRDGTRALNDIEGWMNRIIKIGKDQNEMMEKSRFRTSLREMLEQNTQMSKLLRISKHAKPKSRNFRISRCHDVGFRPFRAGVCRSESRGVMSKSSGAMLDAQKFRDFGAPSLILPCCPAVKANPRIAERCTLIIHRMSCTPRCTPHCNSSRPCPCVHR